MFKQLKFAAVMFMAGFGLAAIYNLIGPQMHSFALHGSSIISTGTFDGSGAQTGSSIPNGVNSAAAYETYINNLLYAVGSYGTPGSYYNMYGAAFIVETMLHGQVNYPAANWVVDAARADFGTWAHYVDEYQAAGRVSWFVSRTMPVGSLNSMHVCSPGRWGYCWDEAVYYNNNYNNGGWDAGSFQFFNMSYNEASTLIVFTNPDGTTFQIRRECANVIGSASPLREIGWTMSGRTTVDVNNPLPGTAIHFSHYVKDDGPADTHQDIWWAPVDDPSNTQLQAGQDSGGYTAGQEKNVGQYTVNIPINTPPGTKICQKVVYDWADSWGDRNRLGPPACATVRAPTTSCGALTVNPALLGSTDSYTVTGMVNTSDGQTGAQVVDINSNFFIKVNGPSVNINNQNVTPVTIGGSPSTSGVGTLTASINPSATNDVGTYTVTYGIVGPVAPITCSGTFDVSYRPYFSVLGGDVEAGAGFGSSCTETSAELKSWNLNTGVAPNYYGAGSEIGAWATANISNFVSGIGLTGGAASNNGYGLSFANTSNTGGGGYGGNFGTGSVPCLYDAYGNKPANTASLGAGSITSLNTGNYSGTGSYTLGTGSVITVGQDGSGQGVQYTAYIQGDLYIRSDIKYSYSSIYGIPRVNFYVKGNIYIDPSVTELHGVFVAQESSGGSGGYITTCATGFASNPQNYATCNKQLTFVGAVEAENGIRMNRTYGNLANAPGVTDQPAEVFQYSPELWMAAPSGSGFKYQAYTSLPPVL